MKFNTKSQNEHSVNEKVEVLLPRDSTRCGHERHGIWDLKCRIQKKNKVDNVPTDFLSTCWKYNTTCRFSIRYSFSDIVSIHFDLYNLCNGQICTGSLPMWLLVLDKFIVIVSRHFANLRCLMEWKVINIKLITSNQQLDIRYMGEDKRGWCP